MEPGSQLLATGPTPEQAAQGQRRSAREWRACTRLLQFLQRPIGTEKRVVTDASPQVDLELLGQGLELELAARSPGSTTGGALRAPSTSPVGAMRWPWRPWASPLRLPGFAVPPSGRL